MRARSFCLFSTTSSISLLLAYLQLVAHPVGRTKVSWSWSKCGKELIALSHLKNAIIWGIGAGLADFPGFLAQATPPLLALKRGGAVGMASFFGYWLLLSLMKGLSSDTLSEDDRVKPNQGVRLSAYNAIRVGGISIVVGLLSYIPIFLLPLGSTLLLVKLSFWLVFALTGGLLYGLLHGGLDYLRHHTLCFLLWRAGSIPRKYVAFLEASAHRTLLHKEGGAISLCTVSCAIILPLWRKWFRTIHQQNKLQPPCPYSRQRVHIWIMTHCRKTGAAKALQAQGVRFWHVFPTTGYDPYKTLGYE
jgi:hypothetical protein